MRMLCFLRTSTCQHRALQELVKPGVQQQKQQQPPRKATSSSPFTAPVNQHSCISCMSAGPYRPDNCWPDALKMSAGSFYRLPSLRAVNHQALLELLQFSVLLHGGTPDPARAELGSIWEGLRRLLEAVESGKLDPDSSTVELYTTCESVVNRGYAQGSAVCPADHRHPVPAAAPQGSHGGAAGVGQGPPEQRVTPRSWQRRGEQASPARQHQRLHLAACRPTSWLSAGCSCCCGWHAAADPAAQCICCRAGQEGHGTQAASLSEGKHQGAAQGTAGEATGGYSKGHGTKQACDAPQIR